MMINTMINRCKLLFFVFLTFFSLFSKLKAEEEFKFHLQPKRAPLSAFEDEYRSPLRLINFKDKIIILNFWATYCGPCVRELQTLEQLSKDMGEKINVIAISVGNETAFEIKAFYDSHNIKYLDVYTDRSRSFPTELGIDTVPFTLLINASGAEVARVVGKAEFDSPTIKAQLKNLLRKF